MRIPVVAIFDVGKTNKKLFLFDEQYTIVFERSAKFLETLDEEGDPCENLESLRLSIFDSLHEVFRLNQFDIKAINFASYGASLVYLDENGRPLTPLYNYLKAYPKTLEEKLYSAYGGMDEFSLVTASPALGSLNAGLQLFRIQQEQPNIYERIKYAVHLPQYLSFLVSGQLYSDMTSIGCHTAMWDFEKQDYHQWIDDMDLRSKLVPVVRGDEVFSATFPGSSYKVGVGLHDSSSALIPYLLNFHEPFILISTGTWSISLNPFNDESLTKEQLDNDCLFYMTYSGAPVKASRLFAGYEHERQTKRIADHFHVATGHFKHIQIDWQLADEIRKKAYKLDGLASFDKTDLNEFEDYVEAYHVFMYCLVIEQVASTNLIVSKQRINRIFVDGGFSKNSIFMNLLAMMFGEMEVYAASMAQATALGAALVIHQHWNRRAIPNNLIELRYYAGTTDRLQ